MLRATEKEFSRCKNYAKWNGDQIYHWMSHKHPGAQLWTVERDSGSRKYLACLGAGPYYSKREYYVDFLDDCLRNYGTSNTLKDNLFIISTST